jgi:hypothetical protein
VATVSQDRETKCYRLLLLVEWSGQSVTILRDQKRSVQMQVRLSRKTEWRGVEWVVVGGSDLQRRSSALPMGASRDGNLPLVSESL